MAVTRSKSAPGYPHQWDSRVALIAQFVQQARGLAWKHPVKVEFLPPARFTAAISAKSGGTSDTADAQSYMEALRAIGVVSGQPDMARAAQTFANNDVVGLYVATDKTVYVEGDQLTPYVRVTLAHELTHALQDQYFNLVTMRKGHADDDGAVTALIEGDAVRIQDDYERTLSAADQQLYASEQSSTSSSATGANTRNSVPTFYLDQATFPYDFGPTFVETLFSQGGNRLVDQAFRSPPVLDRQILDPASFVPGVPVPAVAPIPAPPGANVVNSGGFGEVTLFEMLADQLGYPTALQAVQGWTNDSSVVYRKGPTVCVDVEVRDDAHSGALLRAGTAWAARIPGATVQLSGQGQSVSFHSCDPGPAWKPTQVASVDPYQYPASQSALAYQLMTQGHLGSTTASCVVSALTAALGPDRLLNAIQTNDTSSPDLTALRNDLPVVVSRCS